jgi:predicted ATPase
VRVTAGLAGALKSEGLEPPFVGRDRELRLVKELFHASAEEGKTHLVSVVGIAGIGKSRLAWEFYKYIDGLADTIWWHRGRCLAYGEGVAYWALAEMVRMRAQIVEGEEPDSARAKLGAALELHVADADERSWIEPQLAHLLGLEERQVSERGDLFAAWRLFFERLAEVNPVTMVFEDLQWADVSLLEFLDYLLEWSRQHRIYVLCLARPELQERHPDFGKGSRNATTLSLEPLAAEAMESLLAGFVPGLPDALRAGILERAEGVPLYAVETVRMLLDRGLLVREGARYRLTGEVETLDVPETLHALVAARLDGLAPDERRLLQDGSVLGKTFTRGALAAVSGQSEEALDALLPSLLRKEVLGLQADPRSPERGQYGFLQDLVKRVAYETLSKRERKALHLSAAAHLEASWGPTEHEIVEIVASHYLAAYQAAPQAEDASEIKSKARTHLARAGERAASLAAAEEAQRYFEQAAELAEEPLTEAQLLERAGEMAWAAGRADAQVSFERAIALFEQEGATHAAARVSARLGEVDWSGGRLEQAIERMETAFGVLSGDEPDEDLATLAEQLARLYFFKGDLRSASERIETALTIAENLRFPEVLSQALNTMSIIAIFRQHYEYAFALLKHSLAIALENDLSTPALRAYANLGENLTRGDRHDEAKDSYLTGIALARRVGNRQWELVLLSEASYTLALAGAWEETLEFVAQIPTQAFSELSLIAVLTSLPEVHLARGELQELERLLTFFERMEQSVDVQERSCWAAARARLLREEGRYREALASAREAMAVLGTLGAASQTVKHGFVEALEASLALGDHAEVEKLLAEIEAVKPGGQPPFLAAQAARFRGRLFATRGEHESAEQGFKRAEQIFREYGLPFWLAVTELEHGEALAEQGRVDEAAPLLDEARKTFERLEATPWLERAILVSSDRRDAVAAPT